MFIATLLNASFLHHVFLLAWATLAKTPEPDLPDPDGMMATHDTVLPVGGIVFGKDNG
jgi:hypothetical protein